MLDLSIEMQKKKEIEKYVSIVIFSLIGTIFSANRIN